MTVSTSISSNELRGIWASLFGGVELLSRRVENGVGRCTDPVSLELHQLTFI